MMLKPERRKFSREPVIWSVFVVMGFIGILLVRLNYVEVLPSPAPSLPQLYTTCADSDSGPNYIAKGITETFKIDPESNETSIMSRFADQCYDKEILQEFICSGSQKGVGYYYRCQGGCKDGVCLR